MEKSNQITNLERYKRWELDFKKITYKPVRCQSETQKLYSIILNKLYAILNDVENETFDLHVQFKAISNDEMEAKGLGHELRKLFFLQQPEYDLLQKGIVAKGCDAIPPVDQYLDVDWQFTAGADYTFEVQDNFTDQTQTGNIASVNPEFNIKKGAES